MALFEPIDDGELGSEGHDRERPAALRSAALPSNSTCSVDLLIQRSKTRAAMRLWEYALEDANEA